MGAGAIAEDNCVYTQDEEEARPNEKMLSRATKVTLLVDSSKFGLRSSSTYKVARLNDEMDVITDRNLTESWTLKLQETGCRESSRSQRKTSITLVTLAKWAQEDEGALASSSLRQWLAFTHYAAAEICMMDIKCRHKVHCRLGS